MVSGRKKVSPPDNIAMAAKIMVGMAGWMSASAATVVERVPPILETREEDPTPAARTVVGISSPVYMYRMAKHMVVVKLPMRARTTIGQLEGKTSRGMNKVRRNMTPVMVEPTMYGYLRPTFRTIIIARVFAGKSRIVPMIKLRKRPPVRFCHDKARPYMMKAVVNQLKYMMST